ncbi:MAG TPA: DUF2252 domain-containing protein [Cyanobacteria bacterium UBA11372]|nr:DUF2252 domain-containing protein [Cyanobacteria bacterium UBA11372]
MASNVIERIYQFNENRDAELVKIKYERMRADVFTFFRGTCHLFYQDWPQDSPLNQAPPVWNCGDLHLQNFGTYKGDNRLVYFDINDFDEAVLAPCTWDVTRLVTSIIVASHTLKLDESQALCLCNEFLDTYAKTLEKGQARTVHKDTAKGMVKEHFETIEKRNRKDFLDKRTEVKAGKRRFITNGVRVASPQGNRFRKCPDEQREKIIILLDEWAAKQGKLEFFYVLDVALRIAGTGSLGIPRYAVLIEGKGSPDNNYILDIKQSRSSSLEPYAIPQPKWESEAERIVTIEQRMQGTPAALLTAVLLEDKYYVMRELQPIQDKIDLAEWNGKLKRLEKVLKTMAKVTAWDQLRSGGRQGSAIADDLIAFASTPPFDWKNAILDYAKRYADQVEADYAAFCASK